jgi:hypothetical protein
MHAPCLLAADSVGESLRAAASSQTASASACYPCQCVPVHAVGCMQGCMQGCTRSLYSCSNQRARVITNY